MPSIFAVRPLLPHTHGVFCTNHLKGQQWGAQAYTWPPLRDTGSRILGVETRNTLADHGHVYHLAI